MARKKSSPATTFSPISIGNCKVLIEGGSKNFKCESTPNSLQISASRSTRVKISVVAEDVKQTESSGLAVLKYGENGKEKGTGSYVDCQLLLINPKDADSQMKCLLQEILNLYMKELPAMKYAANTGKQSSFLKKCVSNGKFCTLLLRVKPEEGSTKVVAAVTFQIIPSDTQYAEIPLAAVASTYQHKGIGRFLYMELIKRLQDVGISTVLCWGDKESEGFWHKQGFVPIAEVDAKGKARRLPIKANIRRSLCFPGGSTLMVSHVNKNHHDTQGSSIKLWLEAPEKPTSSTEEFYSLDGGGEGHSLPTSATRLSAGEENMQLHLNGPPERKLCQKGLALVPHEIMDTGVDGHSVAATAAAEYVSSTYERNMKRTWETSLSYLKSKRIKASQLTDHESYLDSALVLDNKREDDSSSNQSPLGKEMIKSADAVEASHMKQNGEQCSLKLITHESQATEKQFNIMLMGISDGAKKEYLKNIIWELGGNLTTDGSSCSHVLTGKARRTLNFCTALCSGAWIVSPNWLKESFRKGRFVDELPFIAQDEDYLIKFRTDLKEAVLRARENPGKLLKGYTVCLTAHVHPPIETLAAIIWSAGGKVKVGCKDVSDKSHTIFIASEDDMEEALLAVKSRIQTFSTGWFMNCIMKQELDLDAPQFAESL